MSKQNTSENHKIQVNMAALLILIASADESTVESETHIIKDIISDFFELDLKNTQSVINDAEIIISQSTDLYHIADFLNSVFTTQDKVDLLYCIFEVAFADKEFHYKERHLINQIVNIMNIKRADLIKAKREHRDLLL